MSANVYHETIERVVPTLEEVFDQLIILGIPRVSPEAMERGTLVSPVVHVQGNAEQLLFVSSHLTQELQERFDEIEDEKG